MHARSFRDACGIATSSSSGANCYSGGALYDELEILVASKRYREADAVNRANIIKALVRLKRVYLEKSVSCRDTGGSMIFAKIAGVIQTVRETYQHAHFKGIKNGEPVEKVFDMTRGVDQVVDKMINYELANADSTPDEKLRAFEQFSSLIEEVSDGNF